jgi:hypothetical protein
VSHAIPVMEIMAISTVPVKPSFLAMGATPAVVVKTERHPAPRWPVLPLIRLPWKLMIWSPPPVSSTASNMLRERRTPPMMGAILGE